MTPLEQARHDLALDVASMYDVDFKPHAEEVIRLHEAGFEAENTIMRGILASHKTPNPCIYCGAESMGKCPKGFPGCGQADDILIADDELAQRMDARIKQLVAALKEVEWGGYRYIGMEPCPCCSNERSEGHQVDCLVGLALA